MEIIDLDPSDDDKIQQTAALLVSAFSAHWPKAWPTLEEVRLSLAPDRISRIAIENDGQVLGWIGAIPEYDGQVWELHPLAVRPDRQGQGIGRSLVIDLETLAHQAEVGTIFLGSDDEDGMTSLTNCDLYPDIPGAIGSITDRKGHPFRFYQKLGFVVVGVVPDANGPGKPDILMAKRVGAAPG